jgi:hypothetical protein
MGIDDTSAGSTEEIQTSKMHLHQGSATMSSITLLSSEEFLNVFEIFKIFVNISSLF